MSDMWTGEANHKGMSVFESSEPVVVCEIQQREPQVARLRAAKHRFEALLGDAPGIGSFLEFCLALRSQNHVALPAILTFLEGDVAVSLQRTQGMAERRAL